MLVLSLVVILTGNVLGGTATRAVLSGENVRVEADLADGRLLDGMNMLTALGQEPRHF